MPTGEQGTSESEIPFVEAEPVGDDTAMAIERHD